MVLDFLDFDVVVGSYTDGGCDAFDGVLDVGAVFVAADQQADGGVLLRCLDQVVNDVDVVVKFACEFGLERDDFKKSMSSFLVFPATMTCFCLPR